MNSEEYKAHLWGLQELHRLITENPDHHMPWSREARYNVANQSYRQFHEFFAPLAAKNGTVGSAVIAYARALSSAAQKARSSMARCSEYRPLRSELERVEELARQHFDTASTKACPSTKVVCRAGGAGVEKRYGSYEICVGPMWARRVCEEGISVVEWQGKDAFIVKAQPKTSAFLAAEGISVWDAYAFMPTSAAEHGEGFIFQAEGSDEKFTVFHTDFMRGVTLIRKRVRDAVIRAMGLG